MKDSIKQEISNYYKLSEEDIYVSDKIGYWSNLTKEENAKLIESLKFLTPEEAVDKYCGGLKNVIFSPKRWAGLELLELTGNENCMDCGCMWGALTIPLAKTCSYVVGVDQTIDSLRLLKSRLKNEKLNNVDLICTELKIIPEFKNKFDIIVVNGVLEWIPEVGELELSRYYGKKSEKNYSGNPYEKQKIFLKKVHQNLSSKGRLYLAIENRYDFKQFFGFKDPHAGIVGLSILPRNVSNFISKLVLKRPYVNWLYSFNSLKKLLHSSGFSKIDLYMCFPDYRFPQVILPYSLPLNNFNPTLSTRTKKHMLGRIIERIVFSKLKLKFFTPSIIAIAER